MNIQKINAFKNILPKITNQKSGDFQSFLTQAISNLNTEELELTKNTLNQAIEKLNDVVVKTKNLQIESIKSDKLSRTPFQVLLDKAVDSLNEVSFIERKNNDLIDQYLQGKVNVEEVMVSTNKMVLSMTLATTIINSTVEAFKQLQQMAV